MAARRGDAGGDRALRLGTHPDAGVRGHRALRAHVRRGLRRRAQGDVHVHRPQRPVADAASRRNGADRPRVPRARPSSRPAAGQGVHDRADVPLRRTRPRALPRALPALGRGDRLCRPGDRRGDHPALPRAAASARRDEVGAAPELDRRRELPPAVRRRAERVARRARRRARRGRPPQARDEPVAGLRRQDAERFAPRSRMRRRSASRSATSAARTSTTSSAHSMPTACRTRSTRRSCAGSTTTRARRSSSSGRTRTPTRRSAAVDATTGWSRRSAAHRRPGSASAPGSSGCCSRSRTRASPPSPEPLDVFFVLGEGADRLRVLPLLAELRRAGVSADLDYAGRSLKGQLTQAGRTGARGGRDRRGDAATIRAARADATRK